MNNPTATKAREELALLDRAQKEFYSGSHYDTVTRALERVGFPYELVQTDRDDLGNWIRHNNYLYYWKSRWDNGSAIYVNETEAGRYSRPGLTNAIKRLRKVLESFAA